MLLLNVMSFVRIFLLSTAFNVHNFVQLEDSLQISFNVPKFGVATLTQMHGMPIKGKILNAFLSNLPLNSFP